MAAAGLLLVQAVVDDDDDDDDDDSVDVDLFRRRIIQDNANFLLEYAIQAAVVAATTAVPATVATQDVVIDDNDNDNDDDDDDDDDVAMGSCGTIDSRRFMFRDMAGIVVYYK